MRVPAVLLLGFWAVVVCGIALGAREASLAMVAVGLAAYLVRER